MKSRNLLVHLSHLPALLLLGSVCSCSDPAESSRPGTKTREVPQVQTSNYPLTYFAERIGGELVTVEFLAPPDGDPAYWKPDDDAIRALQGADLILLNGAGYESWLAGVSLPRRTQLHTSASFLARLIKVENARTHSHGKQGEHSHAGTAFTTWLDLSLAKQQAEAVHRALLKLLPDHEEALNQNATSLQADLEALDVELRKLSKSLGNRPLLASHPVYQYLARAYGLNIKSLHWEPEVVPDAGALAELETTRKGHPAQWMIWEGTPAPESAAQLRELGIGSVVFNPCGNRPDDGDWLETMQQNLANLATIP